MYWISYLARSTGWSASQCRFLDKTHTLYWHILTIQDQCLLDWRVLVLHITQGHTSAYHPIIPLNTRVCSCPPSTACRWLLQSCILVMSLMYHSCLFSTELHETWSWTGIIGPRRMIRLVLVESLLSTGFLIQLIPLQTRPLDEFKCRVGLWAGARGIQLLPNVISILSLDH